MDLQWPLDLEQNFRRNPQQSIVAAHLGSLPDCLVVASLWHLVPRALTLGALEVFFHHLSESKAPPPPPGWFAVDHRQYDLHLMSLLGLGSVGPLASKDNSPLGDRLIQAWPGIFKRCSFLYPPSISPPSVFEDEQRDSVTRIISFCLFSIAQNLRMLEVIRSTPGAIELATRLWLREDTMKRPPQVIFPAPSALLDHLLVPQQFEMLSKIVQVSGASPSTVAKLAVSRLVASSKPTHLDAYGVKYHIYLIFGLTCNPDHPLRDALFTANVIVAATNALVAVSKKVDCEDLDDTEDPVITFTISRIYAYLTTFLEVTDGFTFISQSIKAGLLFSLAFWGARMNTSSTEQERDLRISLISSVLPRYLVYHSVLGAASSSFQAMKISGLLQFTKIFSADSREHWDRFEALLQDRVRASDIFDGLEKAKRVCANPKCIGRGPIQKSLMKCAGCQSVLYCSKACQSSDWKRGNHRGVCKALQQQLQDEKAGAERTGEAEPSKTDQSFFQFLAVRDTKRRLNQLRRVALQKFPDEPLTSMVVKIDYTTLPPVFTVEPLSTVKSPYLPSSHRYRSIASTIEQYRQKPELGTLIFASMPTGRSDTWCICSTGNVWSQELGKSRGSGVDS
ncbi:hypothetical protein JAAARDRAFT_154439 [Jaapia argillacea MUCL 33604]|uniref:MYND-type domain-containing protein n=1 Tax=Jaapia argillacea MUCL 33604 TaxID=933084 RepID=A0A067PZ39_9AGAM|nr:hypothetical protein JAAARDRAFT_154439 [Jaapia argillacea MUCL 33604]